MHVGTIAGADIAAVTGPAEARRCRCQRHSRELMVQLAPTQGANSRDQLPVPAFLAVPPGIIYQTSLAAVASVIVACSCGHALSLRLNEPQLSSPTVAVSHRVFDLITLSYSSSAGPIPCVHCVLGEEVGNLVCDWWRS